MDRSTLWSLRLGYSRKQAPYIQENGLTKFLSDSIAYRFNLERPSFLEDEPDNLFYLRQLRQELRRMSPEEKQQRNRESARRSQEMKAWWIDRMRSSPYPLRDKMCCFWHNHFVSTFEKVRVNGWIYRHHKLLYDHAFGNFRELTKRVIRTNAMVQYLDNTQNRKDKLNENLSRELLELFTLGIGNYTEQDIQEGAKALAGLTLGEERAEYRPRLRYTGFISYLGSQGKYDADDLVDIIFEQPQAPYLITRKIMQWFLYDEPKEEWVQYYGDYLREVDFEIKPFLTKLFSEEYKRDLRGRKIKDPLQFSLQLADELDAGELESIGVSVFIRAQGMDLFNQPNVKGWPGGQTWMTSQSYLQRNQLANLLCRGIVLDRSDVISGVPIKMGKRRRGINITLDWDKTGNAGAIIDSFTNRLLVETNPQLDQDLDQILKYDFDPSLPKADKAVMRLFNYLVNSPEFQVI